MAIDTTELSTNGLYEDGQWHDVVHQVHQRMLQEMDLTAIEKLDAERARDAVASAPIATPNRSTWTRASQETGTGAAAVLLRANDLLIGFA